jgi:hypothetical protein
MTTKKKGTRKRATKKRARKRTKTKAPKGRQRLVLKPGTRLQRTFKGEDHVVSVTKDGFKYEGETYRTLTAAAKAITNYASVSGPRFFGLDAASQKGGSK